MPITLATAPVSWGVMEIKGWHPKISYKQVLDEIAQAGYTGTELGPYGFYPTDPAILRDELQSRGLTLTSAFVPVPLADGREFSVAVQTVRTVGALLSELGSEFLVLADASDEKRTSRAGGASSHEYFDLTDEQWNNVVTACHGIADICRNMGLQVVFHHHVGSCIETPAEMDKFLSLTDPDRVGLCLDTGHYFYAGGDPIVALERFGSRIRYLHFKDVNADVLNRVRVRALGFLDAVRLGVFCPLGKGSIDFEAVIRTLSRNHYDGWIVLEQDVDPLKDVGLDGQTPLDSATASRRYLQSLLERCVTHR